MPRPVVPWLVLLAALAAPACRRETAPVAAHRYPLKGTLVSVDVPGRTVTVAHEDVPGLMHGMNMDFVVLEKDAGLLREVGAGDAITATLAVSDSRFWLEDLVVVRKGTPDPSAAGRARAGEPKPGEGVPDVALVDQDGRPMHLADFEGKALALTFIYTRCPLPDYCPLMMRNFAAVQAALARQPALAARTHLLAISFDTKHDTPEVLRAFGKPFQRTPRPFTHWTLATGNEEAIRALGGALGLDYAPDGQFVTHNLRTAVLDPRGRLRRLFRGNDWKPEELVAELEAAAGP